jgi:subtilase family serine protease
MKLTFDELELVKGFENTKQNIEEIIKFIENKGFKVKVEDIYIKDTFSFYFLVSQALTSPK